MVFSKIFYNIKNRKESLLNAKIMKNLQWSFLGTVSASAVMFLVHIISGRTLGPEQYGVASFILIAANTLRTFCTSGADMSLAKELARSNINKRIHLISSTLLLTVASLAFWGLILLGITPFLKNINESYTTIAAMTFLLIVVFGFKFFFEGIARGLFLFKKQAAIKFADAIVICISLVIFFYFLFYISYSAFVLAFVLGSVTAIIFYGKDFLKYLNVNYVTRESFKRISLSGILFAFSSLISSFILLSDRFIVNRYLGQEALGVYSAYAIVSITIAGLVIVIINNVFFVHVAQHKDKKGVVKKIDNFFQKGFVPSFISLVLLSSVAILFFGEQYTFNFMYIILFSFYSSLTIFGSLYGPIITTYSNRIFAYILTIFIGRIIVLILYYSVLIYYDAISIQLILVGLIFDYMIAIIITRLVIGKFIK